jgi:hypothetical protein
MTFARVTKGNPTANTGNPFRSIQRGCSTFPKLDHDGFADRFLRDWIGSQIGSDEFRLLVLLRIDIDPECQLSSNEPTFESSGSGEIGHVITNRNGQVWQPTAQCAYGVWGQSPLTGLEPDLAIASAQEICAEFGNAGRLRCTLHSQVSRVAKERSFSDREMLAGFAAQFSAHVDPLVGITDPILVSEAFKTICRPQQNLLPVSIMSPHREEAPKQLYALIDGASDERLDSMQEDGHQRHGDKWMLETSVRIDALGDLKPLVMAAAIAGQTFATDLLAPMLDMEPSRLSGALDALAGEGIIAADDNAKAPPCFTFRDPILHQTAYGMIPPGDRLRLHRKAADAISEHYPRAQRAAIEAMAQQGCLAGH